jgi:AcrR family transcriptional regulator
MFREEFMSITEKRRNDETVTMKKRIQNAALSMFLRDGIEKVTMRKIASKIRYSPATIYNYYRNKNDIFLALRQAGFAQFQSYQEKSRKHKSARKRILAHGRAYLQFAFENPRLYELMFIIKAPMGEVARDAEKHKTSQSFQYLKDDIALCMKEGLIKRGNADAAALAFWSIGHGLASLLIRQRLTMFENKDHKQLIERAADYLHRSVILSN